MDTALAHALIAGARAFADTLEQQQSAHTAPDSTVPRPGTATSMLEVLRSVAAVNDDHDRGANDPEIREIARRAGMDPRGIAGYHAAGLLEKRDDGTRWITPSGRARLDGLTGGHTPSG